MTLEQRAALTWQEAHNFVVADTLQLAKFGGIKRRELDGRRITPWGAAMLMYFTPETRDELEACFEARVLGRDGGVRSGAYGCEADSDSDTDC